MRLDITARLLACLMVFLFAMFVGMVITAFTQDAEWKKYEFVGSAQQMAFMVNVKDATAVKNRVLFKGRMADALTTVSTDGERFLGPDYDSYVQTDFEANCDTYEYTFLRATGLFRGQVVNVKYEANNQVADKKTIIGLAIEKVCKAKLGLRAVKGKLQKAATSSLTDDIS